MNLKTWKIGMVLAIYGILLTGVAVADVQMKEFAYKPWGAYYITTGDDASNGYNFAGYADNKIPNLRPNVNLNVKLYNATTHSGQLHKVLINDNSVKAINVSSGISLGDGYIFKVVDYDRSARTILINLIRETYAIALDSNYVGGGGSGGGSGGGGDVLDSTPLSPGDTYVYSKKLGNASDVPVILIHIDNIYVDNNTTTVYINGIFQVSESYITILPKLNIISWSNNFTNDKQLNLTVPVAKTIKFDIVSNDVADVFAHSTNGTLIISSCIDKKNCYQDVRFDSVGIFYVNNIVINNTHGSDSKTWYVTVLPINLTPTQTVKPTPTQTVKPTPTITIPTVIPTQTATAIPTITHTPISKSAELKVIYEIGAGNDRQHKIVTIRIKNIGNATASYINAKFENPSQIEAKILSGGEQVKDTFTWKGELKPEEDHGIEYSVNAVVGQEIGIQYEITYAKISPEEKAMALGISVMPENADALLSPSDYITIFCKIWLFIKESPGFEYVITLIAFILVIIKIRKREGNKTPSSRS